MPPAGFVLSQVQPMKSRLHFWLWGNGSVLEEHRSRRFRGMAHMWALCASKAPFDCAAPWARLGAKRAEQAERRRQLTAARQAREETHQRFCQLPPDLTLAGSGSCLTERGVVATPNRPFRFVRPQWPQRGAS